MIFNTCEDSNSFKYASQLRIPRVLPVK